MSNSTGPDGKSVLTATWWRRPAVDQGDGAADDRQQVGAAAFGAGRTREVEEHLDARFHTADLVLDDAEILGRQARGRIAFQTRLHQNFDRGERIAQLMSNPGGHLTDGGQLLGPQHLALALVQALEHLFNLREDALHQGCRGRRRVVVLDRDRPQVAGKQAGRVADAHAELDHRLMHSSRHRVAEQPAGQRRHTGRPPSSPRSGD